MKPKADIQSRHCILGTSYVYDLGTVLNNLMALTTTPMTRMAYEI